MPDIETKQIAVHVVLKRDQHCPEGGVHQRDEPHQVQRVVAVVPRARAHLSQRQAPGQLRDVDGQDVDRQPVGQGVSTSVIDIDKQALGQEVSKSITDIDKQALGQGVPTSAAHIDTQVVGQKVSASANDIGRR